MAVHVVYICVDMCKSSNFVSTTNESFPSSFNQLLLHFSETGVLEESLTIFQGHRKISHKTVGKISSSQYYQFPLFDLDTGVQ